MDESFLKMDVFFVITTIAVVILTVLMTIGLFYVLSILKTIRKISKTAQTGAETIVEGIQEAKGSIEKYGLVAPFFTSIFKKFYKKSKKK